MVVVVVVLGVVVVVVVVVEVTSGVRGVVLNHGGNVVSSLVRARSRRLPNVTPLKKSGVLSVVLTGLAVVVVVVVVEVTSAASSLKKAKPVTRLGCTFFWLLLLLLLLWVTTFPFESKSKTETVGPF